VENERVGRATFPVARQARTLIPSIPAKPRQPDARIHSTHPSHTSFPIGLPFIAGVLEAKIELQLRVNSERRRCEHAQHQPGHGGAINRIASA
jgi:hypothetical protein